MGETPILLTNATLPAQPVAWKPDPREDKVQLPLPGQPTAREALEAAELRLKSGLLDNSAPIELD